MPRQKKKPQEKSVPFQNRPVSEDIEFQQGEIVWAKLKGFPPWPAIVAQHSEEEKNQDGSSQQDLNSQGDFETKESSKQTPDEAEPQCENELQEQAPQGVIHKKRGRPKKDIHKISTIGEEKLMVNFIGDKSHAEIPISRIQKWKEFFKLYSRNKKPGLQSAIKQAQRIVNGEINYSDHLADIELCEEQEQKQNQIQETNLQPRKKRQIKKMRTSTRKAYNNCIESSQSQYEFSSEESDEVIPRKNIKY